MTQSQQVRSAFSLFVAALIPLACAGTDENGAAETTIGGAGASSIVGTSTMGGAGASSIVGTSTKGGTTSSGDSKSTGGSSTTSGASTAGGTTGTGGTSAVGGTKATGGSFAKGGTTGTGGTSAVGGTKATGGSSAKGGTTSTGGSSSVGGSSTTTGCGPKPGPSNTGVPAGVTLKPSGSLTITTAGTVIDGLDIDGCVRVRAENVVIRNTRIRCTDYYPLWVESGSLLIEDSEIAASGGSATSGIAFSNYTARRVNVHGAADGMKADSDVVVEASWIHDLWLGDGDHADGVQSTGGANVTFRCNFIDIVDHGQGHGGDPNSCFQVGTEWAPDSNFVIDQNWLSGGGWVINMGGGGPGNRITNNRFTRDYGYGPISVVDDNPTNVLVNGNVWDDTGAPIN